MMAPRLYIVPLAIAVLGLAVASAEAAPSAGSYKVAVKLENNGEIVDALAMFEGLPKPQSFDTRLHIASCKRKLGRYLEAAHDLEAIRDDSHADGPTKDTAESDLQDLKARTPILTITGGGDLSVALDGTVVKLPASIAVDPGSHVIVGHRATKKVFERQVQLNERTSIEVAVDVPVTTVSDSGVSPVGHTEPTPATTSGSSSSRPLGIVIGGVGLVGLGIAGFAAFRVDSLVAARDSAAAAGDTVAFDNAASARTFQTIGRVALGAGVLCVGIGTYVFLSSARSSPRIMGTGGTTWGLRLEGVW